MLTDEFGASSEFPPKLIYADDYGDPCVYKNVAELVHLLAELNEANPGEGWAEAVENPSYDELELLRVVDGDGIYANDRGDTIRVFVQVDGSLAPARRWNEES